MSQNGYYDSTEDAAKTTEELQKIFDEMKKTKSPEEYEAVKDCIDVLEELCIKNFRSERMNYKSDITDLDGEFLEIVLKTSSNEDFYKFVDEVFQA